MRIAEAAPVAGKTREECRDRRRILPSVFQYPFNCAPKPHVLDDYTVGRVFEVFGRQKDDLWLFEEQLARWKMDKLSVGHRDEVDRLTEQVGRCRTVIDSILSLAEQLKQGTIEKVLAKSDLELGLEFLPRNFNP